MRRGVKALEMKPRSRVWSGGWRPESPEEACDTPASAKIRATSGGRGL